MSNPDITIRKALEAQLQTTLPDLYAANLIEFENLPVDKDAALTDNAGPGVYVRARYLPADERPMTLGNSPRIQHDGIFTIGIFLQSGKPTDIIDTLVARLRAGFPLSTPLTRDGLTIEIARLKRGAGEGVPSWYYVPFDITWTLWRET
ncbi:MAG: DUF4128 domain-containing protein [Alphaproteobacteria bacterium]|nr:DUF4128 domain-containing protein [Alphaproteobacteria bacterium]